ncbi:hypothetical protein QNH99_05870 [Pantoea allii]|uniref:hypothetical protein n=1 Tax=Pantoea allii TaxID=574096 RepID=UPI0039775401
MAVFAVVAIGDTVKMGGSITQKLPPQDYHKVDNSTWFVSAPANLVTPKEVCDFLGITNGLCGWAIVTSITTYYGFHSKNTWDWLTAKGV